MKVTLTIKTVDESISYDGDDIKKAAQIILMMKEPQPEEGAKYDHYDG